MTGFLGGGEIIGKDSVTLNQVMVPIAKFLFSQSIKGNVEDLIISNDKQEKSFGTVEKTTKLIFYTIV